MICRDYNQIFCVDRSRKSKVFMSSLINFWILELILFSKTGVFVSLEIESDTYSGGRIYVKLLKCALGLDQFLQNFFFPTWFSEREMSRENYPETFLQASQNSSRSITISCSPAQIRRLKSLLIPKDICNQSQSPFINISPICPLLLHLELIFINLSLDFTCITGILYNNLCVSILSCYNAFIILVKINF